MNRDTRGVTSAQSLSILALAGAVAVALSLLFAASELRRTAAAVTSLRRDSAQLSQANTLLATTSDSLLTETRSLRRALTAARSAISAYHQGRYADAVELYDLVIRDDSTNAYLLDLRAYSLFKAKRYEEALVGINLSIRADSTYDWAYFDKTRIQCALHQWDSARATLSVLLSKAPGLVPTMRTDTEFTQFCKPIFP